MRLLDAFEIIRAARPDAEPFRLAIACGFTPLHWATFLQAGVQQWFPGRRVTLTAPAIYGDLVGSLRQAAEERPDAVAVAIEWPDLDPRLGLRRLGGWTPEVAVEIGATARSSLTRISAAIRELARVAPVVLSPPTLALPPFSHEPGWQSGAAELDFCAALSAFLADSAAIAGVRVISSRALDETVPAAERLDLKSEIHAGFPYSMKHAADLAGLIARAIANPAPRKGLITDLDDTLWRGILGEVGVQGVAWDLDRKAHIHGIYQQYLAALGARGVLLAAVSKNDPGLVAETFRERADLLLAGSALYPIEAGWGRKSEAVTRVLRAWNVGADSVVFIDDSPMELEEVRSAHPSIETFRFSSDDPAGVWRLIRRLQDLFGKSEVLSEDRLRQSSVRGMHEFALAQSAGSAPSEDEFLRGVEAQVTFDIGPAAADARALELVNKTNQFNLNGRRLDEGVWRRHLADPRTFLFVISYQDKFGPLGKIAVITGYREADGPRVTSWVMSCRAFARRVEHQALKLLFEWSGAGEIALDYEKTPRNGPFATFLCAITAAALDPPVRIRRADFELRCPPLFQIVRRSTNA